MVCCVSRKKECGASLSFTCHLLPDAGDGFSFIQQICRNLSVFTLSANVTLVPAGWAREAALEEGSASRVHLLRGGGRGCLPIPQCTAQWGTQATGILMQGWG